MAALSDKEIERLRVLAKDFLSSTRNTAKLCETLGAGASAAVFEFEDGNERQAIKVYAPDFFSNDGGPAELRRLKLQEELIGHSCLSLVQLHSVTAHGETCFVVMELVPGFDLHKVLHQIPRASILPLITQLVEAVRYLESRELAHRDIKPHNIRVSSDFKTLKLLDLGVVRRLDNDSGPDATAQGPKKPFIATAQYSSPEYLFWLHPPSKELWHALSIYQVGAVLHDLITRRLLFADEVATENRYALAMAVLQRVPDPHADDVPTWLCALSARCLTKDMTRRVSIVAWEDFTDASNRVASTLRRFQQIRSAGISPAEDGIRKHERSLRRRQLVQSVSERLEAKVRSMFDGCQLEQMCEQDTCTLIFRVPTTPLRVDFLVDFQWSELTHDDTATINTYAQLRPDTLPPKTEAATHDTCTLTNAAIDAAVDALAARFVEQLGEALEIAQLKDGELDAAISLEKSVP